MKILLLPMKVKESKIVGKGFIHVMGIPKLNQVLYVEGLKINLINISQICYDILR